MTSPAATRANIYGHRARIGYTSPPLTTEIFPYEFYKSETDRIASYGAHFGCEVLGATGWGSAFNQIGRIPRHAALEMGRKLMREHPDADSILLPSPHWPTAEAIDALEREFGVNVMAAHQAIVWDALRRCGVNDRIAGFGRLFREF